MQDVTRTVRLLAVAAFSSMAALRMCDAMLPRLASSFDTSAAAAAQVISAFAVSYGVVQLLYGYLGDRCGKFRVITLATLACTIGSLGCALAGSLGWLVAFRVAAGATAGGIVPVSLAWIGDNVPYEQRQATLARLMSGTIVGLISGQIAGGVFADTVGWRWGFACLALLYAVVGGFLLMELKRRAPGAAPTKQQRSYWQQLIAVLRIGWARVVLGTVLLEGLAMFGTLAFVPLHLHQHFGVSLAAAGAILSLFGLGGLTYTLVARHLIARLGERGLALSGGLLCSAAFALLWVAPSWPWTMPGCWLAGLGFYMLHNTLQVNGTQMAPQARGTAVALFATCLFFGQSVGVVLGAQLIERFGAGWLFAPAALLLAVLGSGFSRALRYRRWT